MLIERTEAIRDIEWRWSALPVVAVAGPRQCGKSTLARALAATRPDATFFDLENPKDLQQLREDPVEALLPLTGLVVIDEVQKIPSLYGILRVAIDRNEATTRYLLPGSVSPRIVEDVRQSLQGRVGTFKMGGFDLGEVAGRPGGWNTLWERGGFPRSYLASTTRISYYNRVEYVEAFMERDVPSIGGPVTAEALRKYWYLLAHYHGQVWNPRPFATEMGLGEVEARRYLDLLSGAFVARILRPWSENLKKRQTRSPKAYVRDSGMLHALLDVESAEELANHPKVGASFEGFAIEQILTRAGDRRAFHWRAEGGAELDLLILKNGRRHGFEIKRTARPRVTRSMRVALSDLGLTRLFVVYPGTERYELDERIEALPVTEIPKLIPSWQEPIG